MKSSRKLCAAIATGMFFFASSASTPVFSDTLVNDTWIDGTRTDPAGAVYSEAGIDSDLDGNLESRWFGNATATLSVTPGGPLRMTNAAGSTSATTYFTAGAAPLTLANNGDQLKVTWQFTPTGVGTTDTGQGFRLALVNSPTGVLTGDGSPGNAAYAGYAMFMNMNTTLGNSNSFELKERLDNTASTAFLSAGGSWTLPDNPNFVNGATTGANGYADGVLYTYIMQLTRNGSSLDIVSSMTGGTLNGGGTASVSFTDTTPNSFAYNTFGIRPSTAAATAATFDTSLFRVEFTTAAIPEPSTFGVFALGGLGLAFRRRR